MPPANYPNLTRIGTANRSKNYSRVVFLQGTPVLDTDLNDAQQYRQWEEDTRAALEFGAESPEAGPRSIGQWFPHPLDRSALGENDRNNLNFAVSLGRLATRLGIVDTRPMYDPAKMPAVVFDYQRLVDGGDELISDHAYANFMFKGFVTANGAGLNDRLVDENKVFSADHNLLGTALEPAARKDVVVEGFNQPAVIDDPGATSNAADPFEYRIQESACRVIMLTGANAGQEKTVAALVNETSLDLSAAFGAPLAEGDEYVIVPANMLEKLKTLYDGAASGSSHPAFGLSSEVPYCLIYVDAWEEDVSAEEDTALPLPALGGRVTSHRSQLRWCIRTALMWESVDTDAGRATVRGGHLRWLYDTMQTQPYWWGLGAGQSWDQENAIHGWAPGAPGPNQYRHYPFQVNRTSDIGEVFNWGDPSAYKFEGVTQTAAKWSSRMSSVDQDQTLKSSWPRLTSQIQYALNPSMSHDYSLLMMFCPPSKPDGVADDLSPYFNPSHRPPVGPAPYTVPMLSLHYRKWQSVPAESPATIGYIKSIVLMRPAKWLDDIEASSELIWARSVSVNSHYGNERILVDNKALSYDSLATRLDAMATALYGFTGIGEQWGSAANSGYDNERGYRIAAGVNWVPSGSLSSVFQAGQGARVFARAVTGLLNPHPEIVGALAPIDPLVGDEGLDFNAALGGEFLQGPGEYRLRSEAEPIGVGSEDGWSFYKHGAAGPSAGTPEDDFEPRKWEAGLAQAAMVREALKWRIAMIKTFNKVEVDLFNYDVKAPWLANKMDGVKPVHRHWSRQVDDGGDPVESVGITAISPFYDASEAQDPASNPRVNKESYNVGALPSVAALEPSHSTYWNQGELVVHGGTGQGARNAGHAYEANPTTWKNDDPVQMDYLHGPWGRFPALRDAAQPEDASNRFADKVNPLDTWQNRCTVARLRYHVGDYYRGPGDINALVQTLMLYLRIDPLPLVHWATTPKHQHPVVRDSISGLEGMDELFKFIAILPKIDHLLEDANGAPLFPPAGPRGELDHRDTPFDAQANNPAVEGDQDWRDDPFPAKYQPFVHWHHPNMRYNRAPYGGDGFAGGIYGDAPAGKKWAVYAQWGERSLIVPAITYQPDPTDRDVANGHDSRPPASPAWHENDDPVGGDDLDIQHQLLGTHYNTRDGVGFNVTLSDGDIVAMPDTSAFPFVPDGGGSLVAEEHAGIPGPVFLPAFYRSLSNGVDFRTTNELFQTEDDNLLGDYQYFPQMDRFQDSDNWDGEAGADFPWGKGIKDYARLVHAAAGAGVSAYDWEVPVLRVHIRTTTVAAIHNMFRGTPDLIWGDLPAREAMDHANGENHALTEFGTIADTATDTTFVGDMGCSVALYETSPNKARTFYTSPLLLSMPVRDSVGDVDRWGEVHFNSDYGKAVHDAFQLYEKDVEAANGHIGGADWLPLINTFKALYNAGLAQKLLWNSSFRVLHARPGGGYRSGDNDFHKTSSAPKSLTELFLVRDRQRGIAVPMAAGPEDWNKPFIHLPSIHPAAAGGAGPFNAHPNHAKIGHLYPMISDTLGSAFEGVAKDDLWNDTGAGFAGLADHRVGAAEFAVERFASGVQGDAFAADPFDQTVAAVKAAAEGDATLAKVAYTDRLHENSGVEIDLLGELAYVRENAAAHGLDAVGGLGTAWTSMMPEAKDLVEPGDHEILFVLYTGGYGHRMVDNTVPDMYNPAFCGCRLTATIEVNRPNEKVPSNVSGDGEHYGLQKSTWHGMGHS